MSRNATIASAKSAMSDTAMVEEAVGTEGTEDGEDASPSDAAGTVISFLEICFNNLKGVLVGISKGVLGG